MASGRKGINKKDHTKPEGKNIKQKLTGMLELPREIVLNLPAISLIGREELSIENYKGVIEYTEERVRINTRSGVIKIEGKGLNLKRITSENILITGEILRLEYI